nr:capsid protein [Picobirnavirus sp.]
MKGDIILANRRKPNTKGPKFRENQEDELEEKKFSKRKYRNDPSWHAITPELVEDLGRKSFYHPQGSTLSITGNKLNSSNIVFPGLAAIRFIPSCGQTDGNGGVNLAANQIYSFVRHANSGSANYNAPDLMIYMMAEANVIMYYMHLARLWAIGKNYSPMNRYIPEAYFTAANIDFNSFLSDPAKFKSRLDLLCQKINSRAIPAKFNYPKYLAYMVSGIFKESDYDQSNQYIWMPECAFKYEGFTDSKGGMLTPVWLQPHDGLIVATRTADQALDVLDELVSAINTDEDMGIISGDIMKAYGNDIYRISAIPYDYSLLPIKDDVMLHAIHNATLCGTPVTESIVIKQDPDGAETEGGKILCNYKFITEGATSCSTRVLDSNTLTPAAADMVEWLRYTVIGSKQTWKTVGQVSGVYVWEVEYDTTPVIIPTSMIIYKFVGGAIVGYGFTSHIAQTNYGTEQNPIFGLDGNKIAELEKFDWHPLQYVTDFGASAPGAYANTPSLINIVGDVDVYTTYDVNESRTYNDIEIFSMFVA